jgi:hypothetical protein
MLWATAGILALLYCGPSFLAMFRPPPRYYPDFVQEWLSARNFWAGDPVYLPQREAMNRRIGLDVPGFDVGLPWNAHPPVTILVALPFGLIDDYRTAHLAWNLCTFPLLVLSLWLVFRELNVRWCWGSAVMMSCYLLGNSPVRVQLFEGQLNCLLLGLLVCGWIADRGGYQIAAGIAIGTAMAMKLFPGLLLVYLAAAGRWRALMAALLVGAGLNGVALAIFGWSGFETYIRQVLPSLDVFRGSWHNYSATGYWLRVSRQFHAPILGPVAIIVSQSVVLAVIARAGWQAHSIRDRDLAYALAIVGMLLASPVAWGHYFVMLVPPLALAWYYLPNRFMHGALIVILAVLGTPEILFPRSVIGYEQAEALTDTGPIPDNPVLCLVALGAIPYAITGLFLILAWARFTRQIPAPAATG